MTDGRYVGRSSTSSVLADLGGREGKGKIWGRKVLVVTARCTAVVFAFIQEG